MSKATKRFDGPLTAHLGFWLRFVSNHVSGSFRQKLAQHDVSVAEWACLRELFGCDGLAPSQLATQLGMTRGGITKIVDKLVRSGFATRSSHATDQRGQVLGLTPAGRRLVPVLAALADLNDHECFGHLPPETVQQMTRFLRDLVDHHHLRSVPLS